MRALSLQQPYASAIAHGPKRIENRRMRLGMKPVPCKGALGLWRVPEAVQAQPIAQLAEPHQCWLELSTPHRKSLLHHLWED